MRGGSPVGGAAYTVVVAVAHVHFPSLSCLVHAASPPALTSALSAVNVAIGGISVILSLPFIGVTHVVISGISVEKICADVPAESNGAGSKGSVRSAETSIATEMLASTRTNELRPGFFGFGCGLLSVIVLFPVSRRTHCFPTFVVSFASSRGRLSDTVTRALSLSLNSKPIGIVGVNAKLRERSTSVTFEVNGRALRVAPLRPVMVVFVRSPSSTLMPALSGI